MICVEDVFAQIVERMNKKLISLGLMTNYQFGTLREIVDNLDKLGNLDNSLKYPLVALIEPFSQKKGIFNVESIMTIRFLIATYTRKQLKADERLQLNFKPILFPIYEEFIRQTCKSAYFRVEEIPHTLVNHFEIGRESLSGYDGNVFNDHIDAIEIKDMELSLKRKQCKIKNF